MVRPVYEKEEDRSRELEVSRQVSEKWRAKCLMMPKFSAADMLIFDHNNNPRCWAEIKSRNMPFGKYEHMHVAVSKILRLQQLVQLTKLRAIIIGNLTDGIYWHHCPETEAEIVKDNGGRTDRNDPKDLEPMACFYWHNFKRLA